MGFRLAIAIRLFRFRAMGWLRLSAQCYAQSKHPARSLTDPLLVSVPGHLGQNHGFGWNDAVSPSRTTFSILFSLSVSWTLDYDDYTGLFCNRGEFPFARRVHETMFDSVLTTSTVSMSNETEVMTSTSIPSIKVSSISSSFNRTSKPGLVLVVAPSHRTKIPSDSRLVNHAGPHPPTSTSLLLLCLLLLLSVLESFPRIN